MGGGGGGGGGGDTPPNLKNGMILGKFSLVLGCKLGKAVEVI